MYLYIFNLLLTSDIFICSKYFKNEIKKACIGQFNFYFDLYSYLCPHSNHSYQTFLYLFKYIYKYKHIFLHILYFCIPYFLTQFNVLRLFSLTLLFLFHNISGRVFQITSSYPFRVAWYATVNILQRTLSCFHSLFMTIILQTSFLLCVGYT